ncbi:MAG: BlaI/MecI/CopY family transcriptional regulator [Patescibacteria group bacterium]
MASLFTLGPLETEVMDCLWGSKGKTVREVHDCFKVRREIAYTTVMTVMTRLVDKGLLVKEPGKKRAFFYYPRVTKEKFSKILIKKTIRRLFNTYGEVSIAGFAEGLEELPKEERERLIRQLLKNKNER